MMSHSIAGGFGSLRFCSCGKQFTGDLAALDHVLPLSTRALADKVAADPKSAPEMIARSEALAQEAAKIAGRD